MKPTVRQGYARATNRRGYPDPRALKWNAPRKPRGCSVARGGAVASNCRHLVYSDHTDRHQLLGSEQAST
jgi:hypothetical protein